MPVEWTTASNGSSFVSPASIRNARSKPSAMSLIVISFVNERYVHAWSVETLVGFVYSTSVLPLMVLADRHIAFESDVQTRLLTAEPSGTFPEESTFVYDLARRP